MRSTDTALGLSLIAGMVAALGAGNARAQDATRTDIAGTSRGFDHHVAAVERALEIGVGLGYTQGTGDIAAGSPSVHDLSGAGGNVELQLGYRLTPRLTLGAYGTYAQYARGDTLSTGTDVRGGTAGIFADWQFQPDRSVAPWVGLGSAWRGLWLAPDVGPNTSMQGWEIARLQAGIDYRASPEVAIGPVVGASVNTFFTQNTPGTAGYENIGSPRANFYFTAGLAGRFDVGGTRVPSTMAATEVGQLSE